MAIYNQLAHDRLVAAGFTFADYPSDWEDVGDGESGPIVRGHNGYNEYDHQEEGICIYISYDGVVDTEYYDPVAEAQIDAFFAGENQ